MTRDESLCFLTSNVSSYRLCYVRVPRLKCDNFTCCHTETVRRYQDSCHITTSRERNCTNTFLPNGGVRTMDLNFGTNALLLTPVRPSHDERALMQTQVLFFFLVPLWYAIFYATYITRCLFHLTSNIFFFCTRHGNGGAMSSYTCCSQRPQRLCLGERFKL